MLGKVAGKAQSVANEGTKIAATRDYELFAGAKMDGSQLPQAPKSAFRKRPVSLTYDKNEFYMFRMPSENAFFLQNFDKHAIFGTRHGLQHSPHIKAQMDIDHRILLGLVGASVLMLLTNMRSNAKMMNLRENYRESTYGKFEVDDFVKKQ